MAGVLHIPGVVRKVVRVENYDGDGPYASHSHRVLYAQDYEDRNKWGPGGNCFWQDPHRPNPTGAGMSQEEADRLFNYPVLFGFETIGQLKRWFGKRDRRILDELGFQASFYRAEVLWHHETQMIFNRRAAKLIATRSLLEV